jgi:hypothetical protein
VSQTENIRKELEGLNSPLAGMPKQTPFAVPEGYFDNLVAELHAAASEECILPKVEAPFQAPDGYLEALPEELRAVAMSAADSKKKVISLSPVRKLSRIAAAAILVMGLGFGVNSYFRAKAPENVAARHLSKLDKETISTYVSHHWGDVDVETSEPATASANTEAQDAISKLKSSEIKQYLREHGELGAAAMDEETL